MKRWGVPIDIDEVPVWRVDALSQESDAVNGGSKRTKKRLSLLVWQPSGHWTGCEVKPCAQ
jgi:hypothetical protein